MSDSTQMEANAAINEIKKRTRKLDQSLQMRFCADQFFIGNHCTKLASGKSIIISQNSKNRICLRFFMAADPLVGYTGRDFGIAFNQIDHISLKDEQQENPAVLICTLNLSSYTKMCKLQTGLKDVVEKPFLYNKSLARNLTFILKPWNDDPDTFVKISYNDEHREYVHSYDYDVAKSLMFKEVQAVWEQSLKEQLQRRHQTGRVYLTSQLSEMTPREWVQFLADQKLSKIVCHNGSIQYARVEDNPHGRKHTAVATNGFDHRGTRVLNSFGKAHASLATQEKSYAKKRKLTEQSLKAHGDFTFPQVSFPNTQQGSCLPSTPTAALPPTRPVVEKIPPDTQLFTFPPSGSCTTGMDPVVLLVKDIKTLDRKEFLNDSVMAFMLNYIAFMLSSELMKSVHMCNTFLFVNLTRLLPPLCFSKRRPIEPEHIKIVKDNCPRVLRWTRKFDVLAKDYIIIPINEDLHWLVIAVINPSGAIVDMSNEEASRAAPKCYIVFFDPLSGLDPSKKNHMCHCIKIYLAQLYENTKAPGMKFASKNPTIYDEERVVVTRAENTPIQDNFYDCGLYVLHFIEGLFCYPNRPVNVNDFPNFDWSKFFPEANKMCDLMRDKVYNLILQQADKPARSRLAKFERENKCGLSREGALRKARRHSAVNERRTKRHRDYYARHYSLSPPHRNVMNDDPTFMNPRGLAEMPITRLVRRLRIPEDNFPIAY
ncbi:Ubiquitin-like protease family profile domain-containing protein [Caenorhabditis elegans]|uniref:Ubiquitin-like protease family profile domain-containing protein n=1 Tax=Caenorhabditis elegans TaxID=6239 RepID=A0A0S4XR45_CAEEL|nr:Ubiquitin-like protease family profile domain-containing protein [Caenorhabditis elegans]CUV67093.1 Ubiquitin-like protease family profile domain-containing protein [Caenorhabditis elegans]|eukprot:NP_001305240.1 Ubiquitin-like protease 2 [Caenorhabditis elegans]